MDQKKCYMCKSLQPIENFHKNRTKKDGRHTECKECATILRGKYPIDPIKEKIQRGRYYNSHKVEISQKKRAYRDAHPEKIKEISKKHRASNPRRWWAKNVIKRHSVRDKPCFFTLEQLLAIVPLDNICPSCGNVFKWDNSNKHNPDSPSLDQVDRTQPLFLSNGRVICRQCNTAKSTYTQNEFEQWIKRVAARIATRDAITRDA